MHRLRELGARLLDRDRHARTAMHVACQYGFGAVVDELLQWPKQEVDAAMGLPDAQGQLPLSLCLTSGYRDLAAKLVQQGARFHMQVGVTLMQSC